MFYSYCLNLYILNFMCLSYCL